MATVLFHHQQRDSRGRFLSWGVCSSSLGTCVFSWREDFSQYQVVSAFPLFNLSARLCFSGSVSLNWVKCWQACQPPLPLGSAIKDQTAGLSSSLSYFCKEAMPNVSERWQTLLLEGCITSPCWDSCFTFYFLQHSSMKWKSRLLLMDCSTT